MVDPDVLAAELPACCPFVATSRESSLLARAVPSAPGSYLRRGHDEITADEPAGRRPAVAFTELAKAS
jgi:hypothetical protein